LAVLAARQEGRRGGGGRSCSIAFFFLCPGEEKGKGGKAVHAHYPSLLKRGSKIDGLFSLHSLPTTPEPREEKGR